MWDLCLLVTPIHQSRETLTNHKSSNPPFTLRVCVFACSYFCICIFPCLQLADLLFITLCVPATAADYAFTSVWQFGEILTSLHIFHISYNHSYIIYFTIIISPFFYLIFTAESGLRRHMAYDNRTIHPSIPNPSTKPL